MNPVHLETLLAIVDEGSFDVAAAVLGISPSAVSQRIKALESSTGRVLLRRATPVTATEAGEILVQSARRMALVQAETDARLGCLLYTSDAADDMQCLDLGGRRIIKKKK